MRTIPKILDELPARVIAKCWEYTGLVAAQVVRQMQEDDVAKVLVAMEKLLPQRAQMSIDWILNSSGEMMLSRYLKCRDSGKTCGSKLATRSHG